METNYTLKRLKLFGTVFAVMFAFLLLGSGVALADKPTIDGKTDICITAGGTIFDIEYEATAPGTVSLTWDWTVSTAYGLVTSFSPSVSSITSTALINWTIGSENVLDGDAWVRAQGTDNLGNTYVSDRFPVELFVFIEDVDVELGSEAICPGGTLTLTFGDIDPTGAHNGVFSENGTATLTFEAPGAGVVTVTDWPADLADGDNEFEFEADGAAGIYTYTLTVTNGACEFSEVGTFRVYDEPATVDIVGTVTEVCYDGTLEFSADVKNAGSTTLPADHFDYEWWIDGDVVATNTNVFVFEDQSVGLHTLTVVATNKAGCGTVSTTIDVEVWALPEIADWDIKPLIWDEVSTITLTFADVVSPPFTVTSTIDKPGGGVYSQTSVFDPSPVTNVFAFTIPAQELEIGLHSIAFSVSSSTGCIGLVTDIFTMNAPVYAMFSPSYVEGQEYAAPPPAKSTGVRSGTTTIYPDEVVDIDHQLWVEFSDDIFTINELELPTTDLGEFVVLEYYNIESGMATPIVTGISSSRIGNKIYLEKDLEFDTYYRMRFRNVFKEDGGPVTWTLDITEDNGDFEFDETNMDAYSATRYVIFKTQDRPWWFPRGEDIDPCADIGVYFENPVKYLSGQLITEDGDPHHKFKLQVGTPADKSFTWEDLDFSVEPKYFVTDEESGEAGPTAFYIIPDEPLTLSSTFRVILNPAEAKSFEYGFIDIVTGENVLGGAADIGWQWTTQDHYIFEVSVNDAGGGLVSETFNRVEVMIGDKPNKSWELVGTVTSVEKTFDYAAASGTFTFIAKEGEKEGEVAYQFEKWQRHDGVEFVDLVDGDGELITDDELVIDLTEQYADCVQNMVRYKAVFQVKEYVVGVGYDTDIFVEVTPEDIANATDTFAHGNLLTITATPKTGYQFDGWEFSVPSLAAHTDGTNTTTYTFDEYNAQAPAVAEFHLIGGVLSTAATYIVTPTFDTFDPTVYAVAVATPTVTAGVASITITTNFEILESGITDLYEPVSADGYGLLTYTWSTLRPGAKVTLTADDPPLYEEYCEFSFYYWEELIWEGGEYVFKRIPESDLRVNGPVLVQEPVSSSKRYRAIYGPRTIDLFVDIQDELGTFVIEDGDKEYINETAPVLHGNTVTITIYPVADYYTYTWKDELGIATDVIFKGRFADIQRRSVWTYEVVGCVTQTTLEPVIEKQRYEVTATILDMATGETFVGGQFDPVEAFDYDEDTSHPVYVIDGGPDYATGMGLGFKYARATTLWNAQENGVATDPYTFQGPAGTTTLTYAEGWIEKGTEIVLVATATPTYYEFQGWFLADGDYKAPDDHVLFIDGWKPIGTDETLEYPITKGAEIQAWYKAVYDTRLLNVEAVTDDITADPIGNFWYEATLGYVGAIPVWTDIIVDEEVFFPAAGVNTITIHAADAAGWSLTEPIEWTVNGEVLTSTLAAAQIDVPVVDDGLDVEVSYRPAEYVLTNLSLGYRFKAGSDDPDEYEVKLNHGGTITNSLPVGQTTVTFNEPYTFEVTQVNPGWKFVNWVVGTFDADGNPELTGYEVGTDLKLENFHIPVPLANGLGDGEIGIFAVFKEVGTEVLAFPTYIFKTTTNPLHLYVEGMIGYDGVYVHGMNVALFNDILAPAGYEFDDDWKVYYKDEDGDFEEYDQVKTEDGVDLFNLPEETDELLAVAQYTPIDYTLFVDFDEDSSGYGTIGFVSPVVETDRIDTEYTIEDNPIRVRALPLAPTEEWTYTFVKWTYLDGSTVTDAQGNPVGNDFFFIPRVPEEGETAEPGMDGLAIDVYAHFNRAPAGQSITLTNNFVGASILTIDGKIVESGVPDHPYELGEPVVIKTQPNDGFEFVRWEKEGVPFVFDMQFNYTFPGYDVVFDAIYETVDYDLTVNVDPEDAGLVNINDGDFAEEVTGTFTVLDDIELGYEAATGYVFAGWEEDGEEVELADIFVDGKMPARDVELTAKFELVLYTVEFVVKDEDGVDISDEVTIIGDFEEIGVGTYTYGIQYEGYNDITGIVEVGGVTTVITVEEQFKRADAPDILAAKATAFTAALNVDAEAWTLWMLDDDDELEVVSVFDEAVGLLDEDLEPGTTYEFFVTENIGDAGYALYSYASSITATTVMLGDVDNDGDLRLGVDLAMIIDYIHDVLDEDVEVIVTADEFFADDKDAHEVEYFIFDAADINGDETLNIIDIVKWLRIYHDLDDEGEADKQSVEADIYLAPGMIQLDSDGTLAGIQFELTGTNLELLKLESMIPGFVVSWSVRDNTLTGLIYHPDAHIIAEGMVDLIKVENAQDLKWGFVFAANLSGQEVAVNTHEGETSVDPIDTEIMLSVFPNPSRGQFTTEINTPTASNVEFRLYDLTGRQVAQRNIVAEGYETISWNEDLRPGMYILRMVATPEGQPGDAVTREIRILINK